MYSFDANAYGYDYLASELPNTDCQEDPTGEVSLQGVIGHLEHIHISRVCSSVYQTADESCVQLSC